MILQQTQLNQVSRRAAFTLMEMLVVVAIVVVLAGLGGFYVMGQLKEAQKDAAKVQCKVLRNAVSTYMLRNKNQAPQNLEALRIKGPGGETAILDADASIIDPWGNPYIMEVGPDGVKVYSQGPPGGTGRIE